MGAAPAALLLLAAHILTTVPGGLSWSQSGPNPEQDLSVTVTLQTDSRGTGTVTNNSTAYHYRGDLSCVSTCPGPEPGGCSTTNVLHSTKEVPPGQSRSCIMFSTTHPCCQDDGEYYVSALFTAWEYRLSLSDPWSPLPSKAQMSWSSVEQDAGAGNPPPKQSNPDPGHILLTATCKCLWTSGCDPNSPFAQDPQGTDVRAKEVDLFVDNTGKKQNYRIRVRVAGYCPANSPADPNLPYCSCPCGYCDPVAKNQPACPANPNPFEPGGVSCMPYPKEFHLSSVNSLAPLCNSLDASLEFMDPADPNIVSDPNLPPQAGHWPYCVMIIQPDQTFEPLSLGTLNECCDVAPVRNIVWCAEVDTFEAQKPNDTFRKVTNPNFDKSFRRRCVDNPADIQTMQDITCFSAFADPRSPTGICANPI